MSWDSVKAKATKYWTLRRNGPEGLEDLQKDMMHHARSQQQVDDIAAIIKAGGHVPKSKAIEILANLHPEVKPSYRLMRKLKSLAHQPGKGGRPAGVKQLDNAERDMDVICAFRELLESGTTWENARDTVASRFNLTSKNVERITKGHTWDHLNPRTPTPPSERIRFLTPEESAQPIISFVADEE